MGQYFLIVNETKRQFLHPHCWGFGLKFGEFCSGSVGPMTGLAYLLAEPELQGDFSRGGDDVRFRGAWIGCDVRVCGDYGAEVHELADGSKSALYDRARADYTEISGQVMSELLLKFPWMRREIKDNLAQSFANSARFGQEKQDLQTACLSELPRDFVEECQKAYDDQAFVNRSQGAG